MFLSQIKSKYIKHAEHRICQGDILNNIIIREYFTASGSLEVEETKLPYCVVLTQDCDLEQDFKSRNKVDGDQDKYIQSVLICPAYLSEQLKDGNHLSEKEYRMQKINSNSMNTIKNNSNPRYHYLEQNNEFQIPDLIIDFKHYFCISVTELKSFYEDKNYLATIGELFRENLSHRFAHYISRIGLPEIENIYK